MNSIKNLIPRQHARLFAFEVMEQRCLLSGATIGMNLDGISDDSTNGAFNDLARMFRPWGRPGTPYQPDSTIAVTGPSDPWPDNYPLVNAGAISYATAYPDGVYQVSYDGVGTVNFVGLGHAYFTVTSHVGDHWTGDLDLAHDANGGGILELHISNINPANPIRNLHIISPDANPAVSPTFRKVFLDKLKDWNGPLRFMDWQQTNYNPQVDWADRTHTDRFSYVTGAGVPFETIIELANLTHKDVWINTPFHATDDFVKQMADMFRDQLDPTLHVYVENSNELWNIQFQQSKDLLFASRVDPDPFILGSDDVGRMAQLAGRKMGNVVNIFHQEFGAARSASQLRPIFGSFIALTYWAQKALGYIDRRFGRPSDYIYGLAIAPYVGAQGDINSIDDDTLTMEKLFASMNSFIDVDLTQWTQQHKALCDYYGLKLESYEAGQSLQAQNGKNEALKVAAQDDPRMGLMYQHLINMWVANGGDIFNNFSLANHYSINGYWGLLDRIDRTTSVKFAAVHSMLPSAAPVPARQVSISGGLVGNRGDVVHAQVSIDDAAGLSGIDLTLNYNTALLDLSDADVTLTGPLASNWTLVRNIDDATGKVKLIAFTSGTQPAGGGPIFDLAFHVRSDAPAGTALLDIDDTGSPAHSRLNEGQIPGVFTDGSIIVPIATSITGAPPTNLEGTPVTLGASLFGQSGVVSYLWHVVASNGQTIADSTNPAFSFTPNDNGAYTVTLTVTDQNGNGGSDTKLITITNVAPGASITGAPPTSPEGSAVTLGSSVTDAGSADTFGYAWTVLKDGQPFASGSGSSLTFTPNDNGSYVVTLTVTDDDGGVGTDTRTITVTNVNPIATINGAPAFSPEGTAIHLTSSASDAGTSDTFTYAWTVTKDGNNYLTGSGATFSFTPDDNGSYVVTLNVTDKDGGIGTDTATVTVTNVNPVVTINGAPASSPEGADVNLTSTVVDPGSLDTFTYAWTMTRNGVIYKTGSTAAFTFKPDDNGSYVVTLTVTDKDGGVGIDSKTITVNNVAPTATIIGAPTDSPEGTTITLTSTATDPGSADILTYAWSVTKNGNVYATGSATDFNFKPDDNGVYVVTLTVTDDDGGIGADSKTITVNNVDPIATIIGAPDGSPEGTPIHLGSNIVDPGSADTFGYAWTVTKNGTLYASGAAAAFTFTPDDNGSYVVTFTVTDDDGGVGTDTATITVTNVNPVATINGAPASSPEETAIALTGSAADAGAADTFSYEWTVTRGGNAFATGSSASFTFTPDAPGDYVVNLRILDDDGGVGLSSVTIHVTPVTFRVTSLSPTDYGFDLAFIRGVNFGALNLYQSVGGSHGQVDLTVTGSTQGTIYGSLVYDAGRNVYSFIKTGGSLLPDTYTVSLHSSAGASDGWTDLRGEALDGNADGTAGDAYTSTFVVTTPPERIVSLLDFSRGPGQVVNLPNTAVGLPIRINDSTDLSSVVLTLTYDPSLLNVTGVTGPAGWTTSMSSDAPGRLTITAAGPALANGLADLFHLNASVPSAAPYGASDLIRVVQLSLNGGAIAGHGDAAVHQVVYFGDVTGNHEYSGMDALYIARVAAELDDGFNVFARIDPRIIADVTGDGTLSGLDASFVARKSVGIDQPQIPDLPAAPPSLAAAASPGDDPAQIHFSLPANLIAGPGSTIVVPVNISAFAGIQAIDLTILYDTRLLDLANADVKLGQTAAGWTLVQNVNDSLGKLRLTLYRLDPGTGDAGAMLDLAFHIPQSVASGTSSLNLAGRIDEGGVSMTSTPGSLIVDATPPTPIAANFDPNGGAHTVTVRFSENVKASLSANDLTLTDTATDQALDPAKMAVTYDPLTNSAVITFPGFPGGILPDGAYRLTIAGAGVSDTAGNLLDGSGANAPGSDFEFTFSQLLGDLNRDHIVDQVDRGILTASLGGTVINAADGDTNGDHRVTFADLVAVAQHYDQTVHGPTDGDVNSDGHVDFADLVAVAQHYDRDGRGDLNGDGLINQLDLDLLNAAMSPAAAAPAPPALLAPAAKPVAAAPEAAPAVGSKISITPVARTNTPVSIPTPRKPASPPIAHRASKKAPSRAASRPQPIPTLNPAPFSKSKRIKREWVELGK